MADLINVGTFPNDATGDPARLAFQKINGLASGAIPFSNITVGPPTNGLPPLTVNTAPGSNGGGIVINATPLGGYPLLITGNIPNPAQGLFGIQVQNLSADPNAQTFGLITANDSTNTLVIAKTSSTHVGATFTGTPTGELAYLQSGGGIPLAFVVGAQNLLSLATPQATFFNTPVTAGATVQITNTSAVSGDISRVQLSANATSVALFAAPAAQSVAIVAGGPTGAQSCLRNLGNYPLVFGTANTYRGQVDGAGTWTIINVAAVANQSNGAAGVQASWEFGGNGNSIGANNSFFVGQSATGVSSLLSRGANSLNIGAGGQPLAIQVSNTGNVSINVPAAGDGLTINGVNTGAKGIVIDATGGVVFNAIQINASGGQNLGISMNGTTNVAYMIASGASSILTLGANSGNDIVINAAHGVKCIGALSMNNNAPYAGSAGWGTPTGTGVLANYPGASATLPQTSQVVATLIAILKNFGVMQA